MRRGGGSNCTNEYAPGGPDAKKGGDAARAFPVCSLSTHWLYSLERDVAQPGLARLPWAQEVPGSNPGIPTRFLRIPRHASPPARGIAPWKDHGHAHPGSDQRDFTTTTVTSSCCSADPRNSLAAVTRCSWSSPAVSPACAPMILQSDSSPSCSRPSFIVSDRPSE
jgi:hypothetical protein